MSNLFVEDSQIQVSKSPFSAYEGERKKFDGRLNSISLDHIMIKVKREDVFGVDFDILEAVSELEFSTSRMITQYLNLKGINIQQDKVQNRLNFMNRLTLVSRYKIVNDEAETNTRIYCLERVGKYLLLSREIPCSWVATDSARPLPIMKRILARNQVLLTYRSRLGNVGSYAKNPVFKNVVTNKDFKPDLLLILTDAEGVNKPFVFVVTRSYDGFMEKTVNDLAAYCEFVENFSPTPDMLEPPQLIIVGEDDKHLFEVFKQVLTHKLQAADREFLYTSDLRVICGELNRSLIKFTLIKENEKIKPKIVELNSELLKSRHN